MIDLVKRLRNPKLESGGMSPPRLNNQSTFALMREAADRIDALEATLLEIEDCLNHVNDKGVVRKIARAVFEKDMGK